VRGIGVVKKKASKNVFLDLKNLKLVKGVYSKPYFNAMPIWIVLQNMIHNHVYLFNNHNTFNEYKIICEKIFIMIKLNLNLHAWDPLTTLGLKEACERDVDCVLFLIMDEEETHNLKVNESCNLCKEELWFCYTIVTKNCWVLE
jgi:hypothetical protein